MYATGTIYLVQPNAKLKMFDNKFPKTPTLSENKLTKDIVDINKIIRYPSSSLKAFFINIASLYHTIPLIYVCKPLYFRHGMAVGQVVRYGGIIKFFIYKA